MIDSDGLGTMALHRVARRRARLGGQDGGAALASMTSGVSSSPPSSPTASQVSMSPPCRPPAWVSAGLVAGRPASSPPGHASLLIHQPVRSDVRAFSSPSIPTPAREPPWRKETRVGDARPRPPTVVSPPSPPRSRPQRKEIGHVRSACREHPGFRFAPASMMRPAADVHAAAPASPAPQSRCAVRLAPRRRGPNRPSHRCPPRPGRAARFVREFDSPTLHPPGAWLAEAERVLLGVRAADARAASNSPAGGPTISVRTAGAAARASSSPRTPPPDDARPATGPAGASACSAHGKAERIDDRGCSECRSVAAPLGPLRAPRHVPPAAQVDDPADQVHVVASPGCAARRNVLGHRLADAIAADVRAGAIGPNAAARIVIVPVAASPHRLSRGIDHTMVLAR